MKKWLIPLPGLALALTTVGAAFALSGDGSTPPAQESGGEPGHGDGQVVTSIDDIDPNECNWVHNVNACKGEPDPNQREDAGICCKPMVDVETGPAIAVGEPYPLPAGKECGPGASVAVTSEGQVSCLDLGNGTGMAKDEPGGQAVAPQRPAEPPRAVTSADGMDPNEYMAVLRLAREDLSRRLAIEIGSIELAEVARAGWPVYWPEDPQPGVAYIEIALPGFRMVLEADGKTYSYETDTSERVVFVGQARRTSLHG